MWRRTTAGFYVPAWTSTDVEQRIVEQGHRLTTGVVTGWAALRLHLVAYCDGLERDGRTELPVPLLENGERLTPHPGRLILRGRIHPDDVEEIGGMVRCATVARALLDVLRLEEDDREAVVALDMTLAAGVIRRDAFRDYLASRPRIHGAGRALRLLPGCEPRSRSPQESRLRQIWERDASWDRPLCNVDVCDASGVFIGRPDLLDPVRAVVGEYDGEDHRSKARHARDVAREAAFRRAGLEMVTVVGESLKDVPDVVARLHEAEARARLLRHSFMWSK